MFTPPSARAASAYRTLSIQGGVEGASPHQLVSMLFDGVLQSINAARGALARGDVPAKGQGIGRAVNVLEDGLKASLNDAEGGEVAANLRKLYDYCVARLTYANLRNDDAALAEVAALIQPVAQGWKLMGEQAGGNPQFATAVAAGA